MFSKILITILILLPMVYEASAETNVTETNNLSEETTLVYYTLFKSCLKLYVKKMLLNEATSRLDDKVLEFLIRKLLATNSFSAQYVRILERFLKMILMRETNQKAKNIETKTSNQSFKYMHWRQGR